ncbi:hypothetical protein K491DRAFT_694664 [Lophiostoma macrostomum CBS 122681]|uniref:F-box domain-containing protein n=1 Tax=Lophiostoma macrostomum CBS 122681 TaxID=1314788 RepID=A0A6A6T2X4_9PLEO|nr:hypothetical protein K491DRAFT_694664 [Lophiostoma macrostomum CBS 122681]
MKMPTTRETTHEPLDQAESATAKMPFRFFALPYELRLRIYELILVLPKTIDLDPLNICTVRPLLETFLVSRRMHDEAYAVFYGRNTFRLFPTHGRFHHTKVPLLARLPPRYRAALTKVELRLGPSWTKPPRGWVADGRLGLGEAGRLRLLKVFVEFDPASHVVFEGFRNGDSFYTEFCVDVVRAVFAQVPSIAQVEFDAWEGVFKCAPLPSPLLMGLVNEARANHKRVTWGPGRGRDKIVEVSLVGFMEKLSLGAP